MHKLLLPIALAGLASPALARSAVPVAPSAPVADASSVAPADGAGPATPDVDALPFGSAARIAGTDLAGITGQADTAMLIRAQNSGTVANNSVSGHSQTGGITFDGQSFQGLNGLSLLSANTGNNVSINSSLNVNVSIQP